VKKSKCTIVLVVLFSVLILPGDVHSGEIDELLPLIKNEISGDRAREYVGRMWRYDKWSTLPMWKKTAQEVQTIMKERGFDEAEIVDTPADGVTQYGTWTNPIGWDVTQATLVVTEPRDIPGEFRFLCSYRYNPTSLTFFSCPTPPEGVEAELIVLDKSDGETLSGLNAQGKIILVSRGAGGMKKHLDSNGVLGIVSDQRVGNYDDANVWLNTWSDFPGGWLMNASDSKNSFCFSISPKKGEYLRKLIAEGKTVKVRATIDSRYFIDDTLPYVTGSIKGSGTSGEEVLIAGHMFEWGANDNCTGCSIMLESVGTLSDLITSGVLPRPKRGVRVWMGQEMYGSLAFAESNLDRLRKTLAAVCCDTPAAGYDLNSSNVSIYMNPNSCPTFTDAVFPEVFKKYYRSIRSNKQVITKSFIAGTDTYFCEPLIGVPTNFIYDNDGHLHHNSMDTLDKVDTRSLRDLCIVNALYLYYLANAGYDDIPYIAELTYNRGVKVILDKAAELQSGLDTADNGEAFGKALAEGVRSIEYCTELQIKALESITRIAGDSDTAKAHPLLKRYIANTGDFGKLCVKHFRQAVKEKSDAESIKIVSYKKKKGPWEKEAETLYPLRKHIGTLTLEGIPVEEWKEVKGSPRWWSPRNWAASSYWWSDGTRNLNEIKELIELEAGRPVQNFDLINYFRFLEKYDIVEFMK